jgi:hypothetical protein
MKDKKTAVEWLIEQINSAKWKWSDRTDRNAIIEQAKEMEKEQMKDAWDNGCGYLQENSQQYYNETFKQQNPKEGIK